MALKLQPPAQIIEEEKEESVKIMSYRQAPKSHNIKDQGQSQEEDEEPSDSEIEKERSYRNLTVLPNQGKLDEKLRLHTEDWQDEENDKVSLKSLSFENVKALPKPTQSFQSMKLASQKLSESGPKPVSQKKLITPSNQKFESTSKD